MQFDLSAKILQGSCLENIEASGRCGHPAFSEWHESEGKIDKYKVPCIAAECLIRWQTDELTAVPVLLVYKGKSKCPEAVSHP